MKRQPEGGYRARYRDADGREHGRRFKRQAEARAWVADQEAAVRRGEHVVPGQARVTVSQWCEQWLRGYARHRPSTVRQARTHIRAIEAAFGHRRLGSIRPSEVTAWVAQLDERYAPSTVHATYRRFAQIMGDAALDGLIARSPCSRRTSPPRGGQRPYAPTTEQVWALHDAMPDHLRPTILLGAFAGLRVSEVCGLRAADVDVTRGIVHVRQAWGGAPLKSASSRADVPIPSELALLLAQRAGRGDAFVTDELGRPVAPWTVSRALRAARERVPDLPSTFGYHDLRHYYATSLIAAGVDVKTVQARMRHASATTTLAVYTHLWPSADDRSRSAVAAAFSSRPAANLRPAAE
ncbi:tyrosine-type recombinase/integrase [Dermacoccus nishinomiyaensis]|uniref:tyrosine-type recombinase/integrase n=1 Tax=Dermacoccus nishinomiyaensis TaxID=1274 RepID=UPI00248E46A0|nr:site-specific integrase [Dermacoccus nishinomiyaensis]